MSPQEANNHVGLRLEETVIVERDGIAYVKCTSRDAFVNPATPPGMTPTQVNLTLQLNLGLPIPVEHPTLRRFVDLFNLIFISWYEHVLFRLWNAMSVTTRKNICFAGWAFYFPLHKFILGRTTGLHPSQSEEYHALTSLMWWGRLFPVTIPRMRFALQQLSVWTKNEVVSEVDQICHNMGDVIDGEVLEQPSIVRGYYIHSGGPSSKNVLLWTYGGAYLSGDALGNISPAEQTGKTCGIDVFIPQYRLLPEHAVDDMFWDVNLAYCYLVRVRKVDPSDIILLGISSGGGLATRLMQYISEIQRCLPISPPYMAQILDKTMMPSGAVLVCPFVDYTAPNEGGSFLEYQKHDLIVNQSVLNVGMPYFERALGTDPVVRKQASPCFREFYNLPPMCVVVSEHEVVYDQTVVLINAARAQGVQVTVGLWKYMCHVWCFLAGFVPEGEHAMDFVSVWIRAHVTAKES
jgi:epsilon-lactone hydrolase